MGEHELGQLAGGYIGLELSPEGQSSRHQNNRQQGGDRPDLSPPHDASPSSTQSRSAYPPGVALTLAAQRRIASSAAP